MRHNAIIRIIVYSILVILLLGLLIGGLMLHSGFRHLRWDLDFDWDYDDSVVISTSSGTSSAASSHTVTSGSVPVTGITDLKIHWASGSVEIAPGDVEEITFELVDAAEPMVWEVSGDTLHLLYCEGDTTIVFSPVKLEKDLKVTVPRTWIADEITLESASTRLLLDSVTAGDVDVVGASNQVKATGCTIREFSLDGASNQLEYDGTLEELSCDGASISCTLTLLNHPRELSLDGLSCKLDVTLPADCGFTVETDGLSITTDTDFDTVGGNGHLVHGSGESIIKMEGLSGSIRIRKAQ